MRRKNFSSPDRARRRTPIASSVFTALFAGLLAASGPAGAAPPKESEEWIRVRTANFTLYGNVGERRLGEVGRRIELFREALRKATQGMSRPSAVPTDVFAFGARESFEPYALGEDGKPMNIIGYFRPAVDRNFIALDLSGKEPPYRAVFHEYVHYVVDNNLPGAPTWLNEGLAEFYSTLSAEPGQAEVRLGEPIRPHLATLREQGLIPIDRLFAIDHDSPEYNEASRQGVFYAESWILVHWLIADDAARRARFNDFANRLVRGEAARTAFRDALGMDSSAIQTALEAYVKKDSVTYFAFKFGAEFAKPSYEAAPVPRAEAIARLGDLLVHAGPPAYADAEAHLKAALAIDPAQPVARLALADLARAQEQWDRAATLYEAALPQGGAQAASNYGWLILDRYTKNRPTVETQKELPAQLAKARELFKRALAGAPENATALHGLARTYLFTEEDLTEGVAAARKAHELLVARPDVTLDLITLVAASGRTDAAAALVESDLRRETSDPEYYRAAEVAIAYGDQRRAAAAAEAGQADKARTILEAAIARTHDPALTAQLKADLARLQAAVAANDALGTFNAGAKAAEAGDYAAARGLFEEAARTSPSPEVRRNAEEFIQRTYEAEAESRATLRVQKASAKAELGDFAGAVKELDGILRDEPRLSASFRASVVKSRDLLKARIKKP